MKTIVLPLLLISIPGIIVQASIFTKEQIAKYKNAFKKFDRDGSGYMATFDLPHLLRAIGQDVPTLAVQDMIDEVDYKEIDFEEFLEVLEKYLTHSRTEDEIRRVFVVFDKNKNGFISLDEMRKMMKRLGEKFTDKQCKDMFTATDETKDGKINFEEFKSVMAITRPMT